METISVLIQHHAGPTGDVLIAQRPDGGWEFPTDRIRSCESDAEAVQRLAAEKLGMTVSIGKLTMIGRKKPQDGTVEHIYCSNITHNTHTKCNYHKYYEAVNTWQTEPKGDSYIAYKWVHPSELGQCEFSGDDVNFMAKYDPWVRGSEIPDRRMY